MSYEKGRWYNVSATGLVCRCDSEEDARKGAAEWDRDYPQHAPHKAMQLVDAAEAERLRCHLVVAMDTLREISETPRNRRARQNALATVRFLESFPPTAATRGQSEE